MTDITIIEALRITAISMGVVFSTLLVISFMIDLQRMVFYRAPKVTKTESSAVVTPKPALDIEDEELLVLAMASAIQISDKPDMQIRVKSIKRIQ